MEFMLTKRPLLARIALLTLASLMLWACGGNSDSSSPEQPSPKSEVSVFSAIIRLDHSNDVNFQWQEIDRSGGVSQIGEAAFNASLKGTVIPNYLVSPDTDLVAYWYPLQEAQPELILQSVSDGGDETPHAQIKMQGTGLVPVWLPDSKGMLYSLYDPVTFTMSLHQVNMDGSDPKKIFETQRAEPDKIFMSQTVELGYKISDDGKLIAIEVIYRWPSEYESLLYLLDLTSSSPPRLLEKRLTDLFTFTRFQYSWSPTSNELLYQWATVGGTAPPPGMPAIEYDKASPLMLLTKDQKVRTIRSTAINSTQDWLTSSLIHVGFGDHFEVINTKGKQIAMHSTIPWQNPVLSKDERHLAFLDSLDNGNTSGEVYILDLKTGEFTLAGQGSHSWVASIGPGIGSELRWSPDGDWLAWNRTLTYLQTDAELFAYNVLSKEKRLVANNLAGSPDFFSMPWVTWLPKGNVLNYLARSEQGVDLTITDLDGDDSIVVGNITSLSCPVERAWRSNTEVLWNDCGEGVFRSSIENGSSTTGTPLLDIDIQTLAQTNNREIAIFQPVVPVEDETAYVQALNWWLFDFTAGHMVELDDTGGATCCGTLLQ